MRITVGHMVIRKRISFWISEAARDRVAAMAQARSTEETQVTPSDLYRTLLAAGMRTTARECTSGHVGPIRSGTCGQCGGTA